MAKFTGTDLPQLNYKSDEVAVKKSILDLLDKINTVADAQYPVGYVYTQYPGTSAPATLFGGTWLNITSLYAGLFFRAEGGSSLAFNAGNQTDLVGPHSHTASSGGSGALSHTHYVGFPDTVWGGSPNNPGNSLNGGPTSSPPVFSTNSGTGYTGQNGRTSSANASIDHTHTITVDTTTTAETRPVNTTIRIWQRSGGTLTTTTGTSVTMGIYDSGTNSFGSWIRFTDGTMQCWGSYTSTATLGQVTVSLPQNFIDTTYVVNGTMGGANSSEIYTYNNVSSTTSTFTMWRYYQSKTVFATQGNANQPFQWIAIGKWK